LDLANLVLMAVASLAFVLLVAIGYRAHLLSQENLELKDALGRAQGGLSGPAGIELGDYVPAFAATDLDGNAVRIDYTTADRYVFYVFSPQCASCIDNLATFNRINDRVKDRGIHCYGLCLDSPDVARTALANQQLTFSVVVAPTMNIKRVYRVSAIPQVMLIRGGVVQWVENGDLSSDDVEAILAELESKDRDQTR
jgi:peroxiredoxin